MALTNPEEQDLETARELARWLEESGRRKFGADWVQSLSAVQEPPAEEVVVATQRRPEHITQARLLSLFAMATASFLVYYFAAVNLKILSMWSVIVFVAA